MPVSAASGAGSGQRKPRMKLSSTTAVTATGLIGITSALLAAATYALDDEGRIACTQTGWRGFCRDLLVPLFALVENRAGLRRCANPACRLLFEDGSPNHARRWCDTAGCGNRVRVRTARSRDAGALKSHADALASNP